MSLLLSSNHPKLRGNAAVSQTRREVHRSDFSSKLLSSNKTFHLVKVP